MKTETIPQELLQRHELEWQAIRPRPANDTGFVARVVWQREEERSSEQPSGRK